MAKNLAFVHIGPRIPGVDDTHLALQGEPALAAANLAVPRVSSEKMAYADLEIRRRHTEAGLTRKVVEGAWADVCRKLYKAKCDVVVSQPAFVDAPAEQAALALDGLFGFKVHLVLTPEVAPEDLGDLLGPWADLVTKPGRIHVVETGSGLTSEDFAAAIVEVAERVRRERAEKRLLKRARRAA